MSTDLRSDVIYELTPNPPTLFDDCGIMHMSTKSSILNEDLIVPNKLPIPAIEI